MIKLNDDRLPKRFWDKVSVDDAGCWLWLGAISENGYGWFGWKGKNKNAHRVSYEELVGKTQGKDVLDHLCRVRRCCNPNHLEPVTHAENVRRGVAQLSLIPYYEKQRAKTHCVNGHEYTEKNTTWRAEGKRRMCKECNRQAQAKMRAKRKLSL